MSRITAFCLVTVALATACTGTPVAETPTSTYEQYCAVCHGTDGRTVEGLPSTPNLNSQGLLAVVDDAFLAESIARGRPGENGRGRPGTKMSAYGPDQGGPLTQQQIAELVAHVRQWQTDPDVELAPYEAEGDAEAGRKVFDQCVPCHGPDGWSAAAPSLAGATLQSIASDAFLRHTILHGRPGTVMPAFQLDEREVADLIAFIRTLYVPGPTATP